MDKVDKIEWCTCTPKVEKEGNEYVGRKSRSRSGRSQRADFHRWERRLID